MQNLIKKDIFIANVKWNILDVAKVFSIVLLLPIVFFIIFILASKIGILPSSLVNTLKNNDQISVMIYTFLTLLSEVFAIYWLLKKYTLSMADLGFRRFNFWQAIRYIIVAFSIFIILLFLTLWIITVLLPNINLNQSQQNGFEFGKSGAGLWISFFITVVFTPAVEEIFFRVLMLSAITKKWGLGFGVIFSSLVFGLLHVQTNVIIYTFILGVILSIMYFRLRSIIPGIILHCINNAFAFAVLAGIIK